MPEKQVITQGEKTLASARQQPQVERSRTAPPNRGGDGQRHAVAPGLPRRSGICAGVVRIPFVLAKPQFGGWG